MDRLGARRTRKGTIGKGNTYIFVNLLSFNIIILTCLTREVYKHQFEQEHVGNAFYSYSRPLTGRGGGYRPLMPNPNVNFILCKVQHFL